MHYQESNWRSPKIAQIKGHYRKMTSSAAQDKKRDVRIGGTGFFIRCVEPPPGKSGYLKFEREVIFPREDQVPGDRNEIRRIAENMRDFHQETYGGRWMIFGPEEHDYTYKGL